MISVFQNLRITCFTLLAIIGLLEFLHMHYQVIIFTSGFIALFALWLAFPIIALSTRIIALSLVGFGLATFFLTCGWTWHIVAGFNEMTPLVSLIIAVNFMAIPVELGEYAGLFQRFFRKSKNMAYTYIYSLIISYILTLFSLLGSITTSYKLIEHNLKKQGIKDCRKMAATSVARSYAMATMISPVAVNVGLALKYSGLSWLDIVVPALVLGFAGLAMAFLLEPSWRMVQKEPYDNYDSRYVIDDHENVGVSINYSKQVMCFVALFLGVVSSIAYFENVLHLSALNSIALGCVVVTLFWGYLTGNFRTVIMRCSTFMTRDIEKLANQITLFITAGFFTYAMQYSGKLTLISLLFGKIADNIGVIGLLSITPAIITALSISGLHPFATAIIFAEAFSISTLPIAPLSLAMTVMTGISMSFILSPFSVFVLILSSFTAESPYRVGLGWNLIFALIFCCLNVIFIVIAQEFFCF